MLKRKVARSKLDKYLDELYEGKTELEQRQLFYQDLAAYYRRRWGCPLKVPSVNGQSVDLYKLYRKVVSLGGCQKVSDKRKWPAVLQHMGVPANVAQGEHAIKSIYYQFIARYEHHKSLLDEAALDEDVRARCARRLRPPTADCPVAAANKARTGPTNEEAARTTRPYDSLYRSLLSGLPNEVDFALNVCTKTAGRMHVHKAPSLLDAIVAQAGVFSDDASSLRSLYEDSWRHYYRDRPYDRFWRLAVSGPAPVAIFGSTDADFADAAHAARLEHMAGPSCSRGVDGTEPQFDMKEPMGARIFQVASIVRNLSFEEDNCAVMAKSPAVLKFIFLCIDCKYPLLSAAALDTLGNIATELELSSLADSVRVHLVSIVARCLHSTDRSRLLAACDSLAGLTANWQHNEEQLCRLLDAASAATQLRRLLCVKDVMLCMKALECLFQLSETGGAMCQRLTAISNFVDTLLSLCTIEAVSFGHAGLAGIKVVEYLPRHRVPTSVAMQQQHVPPQHTIMQRQQSQQHMQPPQLQQQRNSQAQIAVPAPATPHREPQASVAGNVPAAVTAVVESVSQSQHCEQAAMNWLRNALILESAASTRRDDAYSAYLQDMNAKAISVVSAVTFTNLIRTVFPSSSLRKGGPLLGHVYVDGVRIRPRLSTLPVPSLPSALLPNSVLPKPAAALIAAQCLDQFNSAGKGKSTGCQTPPAVGAKKKTGGRRGKAQAAVVANGGGQHFAQVNTFAAEMRPDSVASSIGSTIYSEEGSSVSRQPIARQFSSQRPVGDAAVTSFKDMPGAHKGDTLEVCAAAQVAKAFIADDQKHQATIVRVENKLDSPPLMLNGGDRPPNGIMINGAAASVVRTLTNGKMDSDSISTRTGVNADAAGAESKPLVNGGCGTEHGCGTDSEQEDVDTKPNVPKTEAVPLPTSVHQVVGSIASQNQDDEDSRLSNLSASNSMSMPLQNASGSHPLGPTSFAGANGPTGTPTPATPSACDRADSVASSPSTASRGGPAGSRSQCTPNTSPRGRRGGRGCGPGSRGGTSVGTKRRLQMAAARATPTQQRESVDSTEQPSIDDTPGDTEKSSKKQKRQRHSGERLHACPHCDKSFFQKGHLTQHLMIHDGDRPHVCRQCSKSFMFKFDLNRHLKIHGDQANTSNDSSATSSVTGEKPSAAKRRRRCAATPTTSGAAAMGQAPATPLPAASAAAATPQPGAAVPLLPPQTHPLPQPQLQQPLPHNQQHLQQQQQLQLQQQQLQQQQQMQQQLHRQLPPGVVYRCEWDGCNRDFPQRPASSVFEHILRQHLSFMTPDCMWACLWPQCDNKTLRKKWSLATHLEEAHCSDHVMRASAVRRYEMAAQGTSQVPERRAPPPHPGYSRDAALEAIRRHALNYVQRELVDDNEGPVTKSLRLTSALILRNIARYSEEGRRQLRRHERRVCAMAFSRLESSRALAECLNELSHHADDAPPQFESTGS